MSSPSGPFQQDSPNQEPPNYPPGLPGFVADLCQTPLGRAKLSNILHDYREKRLPLLIFKEFIKRLCKNWRSLTSPPTGASIGVLHDVVEQTPVGHLCQGGPISHSAPPLCSRVMDFADLKAYNLDLTSSGLSLGNSPVAEVQTLVRVGLQGITKDTMRGKRPFAWVTPTAGLAPIKQQPHPADIARDMLGLSACKKGTYLIEVQYPAHAFTTTSLHRPTILEGSQSDDYRSKQTPRPGWGMTVNLASGADGLPEAVHPPIPFDDQFRVADLGLLSTDPPPMNWDGFFGACPDPWNCRHK